MSFLAEQTINVSKSIRPQSKEDKTRTAPPGLKLKRGLIPISIAKMKVAHVNRQPVYFSHLDSEQDLLNIGDQVLQKAAS